MSHNSGNLEAEVISCLLDIKVASIRQQGLERVLQTKYLSASFLQSVIQAVMQLLETQGNHGNAIKKFTSQFLHD